MLPRAAFFTRLHVVRITSGRDHLRFRGTEWNISILRDSFP